MALLDSDLRDIDFVMEIHEEVKRRVGPGLEAAALTLAVTCRSLDLSVNGVAYEIAGRPPLDDDDTDFEEKNMAAHGGPFFSRKN